jgi:UDP-N-acetylmuramoyl-tripeptide--D-alanyl-D-alanine ligase
MRIPASRLAAALHGTLDGPDVELRGLAIDSRIVQPGQLFAAVKGERDGHDFVRAAFEAGAGAVLVERRTPGGPDGSGTAIVVPDVAAALGDLARAVRATLPDRVVGVTGSVGKTTTKDLLATVLGRRFVTAASEKSFNNELGVPLTLANAPDGVEAVVVEMGARGAGHIALLCDMAAPTVGVVTTVEGVHTEVMGGLEEIARAKGELVEAIPQHGTVVLNAEVPLVAGMRARTRAAVVTFGAGGDVFAEQVQVHAELRPSFRLRSPWGDAEVLLSVRGVHNVGNALAAAAVGLSQGVPVDQVAEGLATSTPSPWRMDLRRAPSGAQVLNDSYNAGPASMAAALRALGSLDADRHVAVVGLMAELGDTAPEEHRRIAALAQELGVELLAVGTDLYGAAPLPDVDAALQALGELGERDAVLVKGSRVAALERLAESLVSGAPEG